MKRIVIFFIACISWFLLHSISIVVDGLNDELHKTDVAVVLGNKVNEDGTPSNRLQARMDKASELYHEGYFKSIIVSGGVGEEGFDESGVMKNYLINKKVPSENIIEDPNGYNTYKTAKNSKAVMNELKYQSVMVITQYFHIKRTELAFHKVGVEDVYSAHAHIFEFRDMYSIIREFPAYYKYLLIY
ncbi:hypothetical protein N783_06340 [Pontibacillus marinus BH030004 = DSM 16465]|uniref:DUF218 domain-containing protein n=1 Tax=Pontibacillus marinus BH030004 = DSM 16465 TaxID=1385511 RepID=A0A0A5GBS5_9BACI|nr:hypothetical protein N783_06340 [Pontibacillus marinus BH030004 = DSM 16465]